MHGVVAPRAEGRRLVAVASDEQPAEGGEQGEGDGEHDGLAEGLDGASPDAVLTTPPDVYMLLGLHEAITPQRLRGLHSLMIYMQRQVARVKDRIED